MTPRLSCCYVRARSPRANHAMAARATASISPSCVTNAADAAADMSALCRGNPCATPGCAPADRPSLYPRLRLVGVGGRVRGQLGGAAEEPAAQLAQRAASACGASSMLTRERCSCDAHAVGQVAKHHLVVGVELARRLRRRVRARGGPRCSSQRRRAAPTARAFSSMRLQDRSTNSSSFPSACRP